MAGLLASIGSIFTGAGGAVAPGGPVADPFAPTPAGGPVNPTVPGGGEAKPDGSNPAFPATGTGDKSPLDGFKELWSTDPNAKPPSPLTPSMKVDPAALQATIAKIDYTKVIPADILQKMQAGDGTAFMTALDLVAKANLQSSSQAAASMIEANTAKFAETFTQEHLPRMMREAAVRQAIEPNPVFENPAIQPLMLGVSQQMAQKFPNATPAQINDHVKEYMQGMAEALVTGSGATITKKTDTTSGQRGPHGVEPADWQSFFGTT